MKKSENSPSESEWSIMEILWAEQATLTSLEIIHKMPEGCCMTSKMVRVLLNRLCQKGIVGYEQDSTDHRVYHYYALKTREECLKEKSRRFIDSYCGGNGSQALAALLCASELTEEQIKELEEILEQSRGKGKG